MVGKGIPADLLALSVPLVFACTAFSTMVYRVVNTDPVSAEGQQPSKPASPSGGGGGGWPRRAACLGPRPDPT